MAIKTCPTCGQRKMERQTTTLKLDVKGRSYEIPELELDVCLNCGEQLFDLEASRRVEAVVYGIKGERKATASPRGPGRSLLRQHRAV